MRLKFNSVEPELLAYALEKYLIENDVQIKNANIYITEIDRTTGKVKQDTRGEYIQFEFNKKEPEQKPNKNNVLKLVK